MQASELVEVASFLNRMEAELAQGALEAAEIESVVSADDAGGLRPHLWLSGVRLLVRAGAAEGARELLDAQERDRRAVCSAWKATSLTAWHCLRRRRTRYVGAASPARARALAIICVRSTDDSRWITPLVRACFTL